MDVILCCLYVFTELSASVRHDNPTQFDRPVVTNPYATVGFGWEYTTSRTATYFQAQHKSGVRIGDQGDDSFVIGGRLYFGRRQ